MKIGIAGYGYVGKAMELQLKEYNDIIISDPALGHYGDLRHADAIVVCVSTPPMEMSGACDVGNVADVIDDAPDVPILIKSTISLEGWRLITDCCKNQDITFSPEFLRAKHWQEDAKTQKKYLFGGASTNFWTEVFLTARGKIDVDVRTPEELILAKQLRNSFLAMKVSFFNQVEDFCVSQEVDPVNVSELICADERIGRSHSFVTPDRGYGGHCLPKDVVATIRSAQVSGARMTLLEETDNYNNAIRKKS